MAILFVQSVTPHLIGFVNTFFGRVSFILAIAAYIPLAVPDQWVLRSIYKKGRITVKKLFGTFLISSLEFIRGISAPSLIRQFQKKSLGKTCAPAGKVKPDHL
jgi:hypothetical protein